MRSILAATAMAASLSFGANAGENDPVVIELYTSQGCSACPPADALMEELAARDDVIPLALHVDYWDYIGWKDIFADRAYTLRQKSYARASGHRTIYTPQMVVDGSENVVGYKPMKLAELIERYKAEATPVSVELTRAGDTLTIRAAASERPRGAIIVQLVRYLPERTVEIHRGENAGRTITYTNIVTEWLALAQWDGWSPLEMQTELQGDQPAVVILQEAGHGAILSAARVE